MDTGPGRAVGWLRQWRGKERRRPTVRCGALVALVAALVVLGPQALAAADEGQAVPETVQKGVAALRVARDGVRATLEYLRERPERWGAVKEAGPRLPTDEERKTLRTAWASLLDHLVALDALRQDYGDYLSIKDRSLKRARFAVSHGAFLASYRHALEFVALIDRHPDADTLLNDPAPELGLPGGTYDRLKLRFLNAARAIEFAALELLAVSLEGKEAAAPARQARQDDAAAIWRMGKGKGHRLTLKNAVAVVTKAGAAAWFPLQKGVAEWMGDTRVWRGGTALISAEQIQRAQARIQPGDILLERREWFLSNLGLPGFWTHAALYVGTPDERQALAADPEVQEWVREEGEAEGAFERLLAGRLPDAYARSQAAQDGNPPRILEAVSEGVSFTSLEHTAAADSIAVLRPRLSAREKTIAIWRGFQYSGRPYDFNFDFRTDSALVCSELVYKAYEPAAGRQGLRFPLEEIVGKRMVTPNGMARWFDQERQGADPKLDLVIFLDGYERGGAAVESTADAFRQSWQRPKWHVLFQALPEEKKKEEAAETAK